MKRRKSLIGRRGHGRKPRITLATRRLIVREVRREKRTQTEVARRYQVSQASVSRIVSEHP